MNKNDKEFLKELSKKSPMTLAEAIELCEKHTKNKKELKDNEK